MGIVDEDIARVREATDIVAVISQYTQLKRVGRRFVGLCPFHGEKTPSFSVNAEEGLFYCFGCGVKGDAISFVRDKEQLDFVETVERLAQKSGVALRYTDAGQGESRKRRKRLVEAVSRAASWYHKRLLSGDDAGPARSYLRERGYSKEVVEQYQIGWSPSGWDELCRELKLSTDDLNSSGLGFVNRRERAQDSFRSRIMFPIFDAQNHAVGFGGRILPGEEGPKYKNSSESEIYNKSQLLYGLNWAKSEVVKADQVIVCEGYTDVIGFGRSNLPTAVATCGTALTENHVRLLRRFAKKVVLAFDADAAGNNAAERFYEWEKSHDLDVYVANLPSGVDPGELAEKDPDRLSESVSEAKPFLEFQVSRVLDAGDLATAEGRVRATQEAIDLVAAHPEPLVRDQYILTVASRCRLDENLVRKQLEETIVQNRRRPPSGVDDQRGRSGLSSAYDDSGESLKRRFAETNSPEHEALKLTIQSKDGLDRFVVAELFTDELCALTYELLDRHETLHSAIAEGGSEVAGLLQRLSVEETDAEPVDVAGRLWERYLAKQIDYCRMEARTSTAEAYAELNREMNWLKYRLEELREVDTRAATVEELLGWILQSEEGP